MPSKHQASKTRDRPRYPEYIEQFGEDPSRFLNSDIDPHARIRGIESAALVTAYLDVETDRDKPRQGVIAHLNQRKATLRGEGE